MNDIQSTEYGIPYVMHIYDIWSIEECYNNSKNKVNDRLKEGWVILHIGTNADGDTVYVMGQPRPKICEGGFKQAHAPETERWDHSKKEWFCPFCDERSFITPERI